MGSKAVKNYRFDKTGTKTAPDRGQRNQVKLAGISIAAIEVWESPQTGVIYSPD
jgi:hypothetical protein